MNCRLIESNKISSEDTWIISFKVTTILIMMWVFIHSKCFIKNLKSVFISNEWKLKIKEQTHQTKHQFEKSHPISHCSPMKNEQVSQRETRKKDLTSIVSIQHLDLTPWCKQPPLNSFSHLGKMLLAMGVLQTFLSPQIQIRSSLKRKILSSNCRTSWWKLSYLERIAIMRTV